MTTIVSLGLIRDGTIFGPQGTEIDLRTPDYETWITIKSSDDGLAERIATVLAPDAPDDERPPCDHCCAPELRQTA